MFAKFKGALISAVGNFDAQGMGFLPGDRPMSPESDGGPPLKYKYCRPHFLQLNSEDEIQVTADHSIRPIIVPRDITKLPWHSGYAECINAGKSLRNEDQAAVFRSVLRTVIHPDIISSKVADMMPIISSHARQSMNQNSKPSHVSDQIPGTAASPVNGVTGSAPKANDVPVVNGIEATESKSEDLDPLTQAVRQLNASDLLSPSQPLPLSEFNDLTSGPPVTSSPVPIRVVAEMTEESLPWTYFGIFDGHAGSAVAVAASSALHRVIQDKLHSIADLLIAFGLEQVDKESEEQLKCNTMKDSMQVNRSSKTVNGSIVINQDANLPKDPQLTLMCHPSLEKLVTVDSLIVGALESAFWEMDTQIGIDKKLYRMAGGCTVLVSLFILGKVYVANAGDSRCILSKSGQVTPLSYDFTPETERERVKYLGLLKPELLGSDFTHLEYVKRPTRRDLGRKMLYRDAFMTGWSYKTITLEDMKFPLVYGEGKRSRVLATIGVTRGFGDHELKAQASYVDIKPFLTPQPEVRVLDLANENLKDTDVIIMGTDGLWDVTSNETAAEVVQSALNHFPADDEQRYRYRYVSAAQDLVMASRGKQREKGKGWRTADNKVATIDDISVFVIPLKPYKEEYNKWREARLIVNTSRTRTKSPVLQSVSSLESSSS